jgi:DNA (cytosine-5)-methyltransferase 1
MKHPIHIVDLFCGAGGTSTGAMRACDRLGIKASLTAVNHWETAIATHSANHPDAEHLCQSIDTINPRELFDAGKIDILWASPECMHHSVARGGKPVNDQSRSTAWCVTRWAEAVMPSVIFVENVPEFVNWGPTIRVKKLFTAEMPTIGYRKWCRLYGKTKRCHWLANCPRHEVVIKKFVTMPDPKRKGQIFRAWIQTLESIGYRVDWKVLCAADYGDPTSRRRLFVQAVRGRRRIHWPEPTHFEITKSGTSDLFAKQAWRGAREIINWNHPTQSIFSRNRPLSPNTLRRIEIGLHKYGLKPFMVPQQSWHQTRSLDKPMPTITGTARGEMLCLPYLVEVSHQGADNCRVQPIDNPLGTVTNRNNVGICQPFVQRVSHYGRPGNGLSSIDAPLSTVTTKSEHALVEPYLIKLRGTSDQQIAGSSQPLTRPMPTVTAGGGHVGLCEPFLTKFYGTGGAQSIDEPLDTVTCKDRHGLVLPIVELSGESYFLDIHFRMLQPDELGAAQGFPQTYRFCGTKTEQTKQIGNAVPCGLSEALIFNWLSQNTK